MYGTSGVALISQPVVVLAMMGARYAMDYPVLFVRFVGAVQLLGAIGIVLPALLRVMPGLTPAAALGLTVLQLLATVFLVWRGEFGSSALTHVALLCLSLFVLWGRTTTAPILPRGAMRSGIPPAR
jgi:hypothetical protein